MKSRSSVVMRSLPNSGDCGPLRIKDQSQKLLKTLMHLAFAFLDIVHPHGGSVLGLGEQVALGQHQENRQAADFGALAPAFLQDTQKTGELAEVTLQLGQLH